MTSHLVLVPSFNPGPQLRSTVAEARAAWDPVWLVDDGSTDGSANTAACSKLIRRPNNGGKGAAVHDGLHLAQQEGFTHALVMDADGQHPAASVAPFMAASQAQPDAMILGRPVFGADAPTIRRLGRRISNGLARVAAPEANIQDALFGFRVYPIAPLLHVMAGTRHMRGFDFDPEAAIRLAWLGVPTLNLPAPVRYLPPADGGVSHFRYGRDNIVLAAMFARLLLQSQQRAMVTTMSRQGAP